MKLQAIREKNDFKQIPLLTTIFVRCFFIYDYDSFLFKTHLVTDMLY